MSAPEQLGNESIESKDFDLVITITRHGPKKGLDGPLSEEGKEHTAEYFANAYENVAIDAGRERKVVSSPKERAQQTANLYQNALEKDSGVQPLKVEISDFLNEGEIMFYYDSLTKEEQKNWFKYWHANEKELPPGAPDFKLVTKKFAQWLLSEINTVKETGGNHDVDAFSHGPLMGGVLISLEDALNQEIITDPQAGENRIDRDRIFDLYTGQLRALQNINFHISSKNPDVVNLTFLDKKLSMPMEVLEKLAGN